MTTPTLYGAPELPGLALARLFHETYERLAPQFGYTTRPETREFDPESPNGKLMTAVCAAIQQAAGAVPEGMHKGWHHKSNPFDLYTVLAVGKLQTAEPAGDMAEVVVYRGPTGVWVRPKDEFLDGRFHEAPASADDERGQLDPRVATASARQMLGYVESFNGQTFSPTFDSVDRQNLAVALDHLTEAGAMILNLAERVAASPSPPGRKEGSSDHLVLCAGGGVTQPLTEAQILAAIQSCGVALHGRVSMTFESGPYDIDTPTVVATQLVRAIEAAHGLIVPTLQQVERAERYAMGSVDYGAKWAYGVSEVMRAAAEIGKATASAGEGA